MVHCQGGRCPRTIHKLITTQFLIQILFPLCLPVTNLSNHKANVLCIWFIILITANACAGRQSLGLRLGVGVKLRSGGTLSRWQAS